MLNCFKIISLSKIYNTSLILMMLLLLQLLGSCNHAQAPIYKTVRCSEQLLKSGRTLECGEFTLRQSNSRDAKVALPIVIVRASEPKSKDTLFYLHGGPGGGVLEDLSEILESSLGSELIAKDRDWIFFDQRGTGLSTPKLDCGNLALNDAGPQSQKVIEELSACALSFERAGVNFANYNLGSVTEDVISIANNLNINKFTLFGHSYGSRVALEIIRKYPERVSAVVLDSPWTAEASWTETGPNWVVDAMEQVFLKCLSDNICNEKYPNLKTRTDTLISQMIAKPIIWHERQFTADQFAQFIMDSLYDQEAMIALPKNLNQMTNGDMTPLVDYLNTSGADYDEAQHMAFLCHDELAFESPLIVTDRSKNSPVAKAIAHTMINYFPACNAFKAGHAGVEGNLPIISEVPTLFVVAEIDPGCPSEISVQTLPNFRNGQIGIFPNQTHGPTLNNSCARKIVSEFLSDPNKKIDTSCIDVMRQSRIIWK